MAYGPIMGPSFLIFALKRIKLEKNLARTGGGHYSPVYQINGASKSFSDAGSLNALWLGSPIIHATSVTVSA